MLKILIKSLIFSIIVGVLYLLTYYFYNIKIIQERVEDFSFDIVNKIIYQKDVLLKPNIILFTFDTLYLKNIMSLKKKTNLDKIIIL